jgi:DNA polymerase III gamma/tau subunit
MFISCHVVTGGELERLQQALKILSDAEKQIRLSSERSTWFTAALLQLSCGHSSEMNQARSSTTECHKSMNDAVTEAGRESSSSRAASHSISAFGVSKKLLDPKATSLHSSPQALASHSSRSRLNGNFAYGGECMSADRFLQDSTQRSNYSEQKVLVNGNLESLAHIWMRCIENCHSKTLQQLLFDHGKLVCVRQCEGKHIMCSLLFSARSIFIWVMYCFERQST